MANAHPTFFRQFEVFAAIKKKKILSEPVRISLGFSGPIDSESGMILNLADIDAWIQVFRRSTRQKTYQSRWDLIRFVSKKFQKMIPVSEFTEIRFHFHDGSVAIENKEVIISWRRFAEVCSGATCWLTDVTLSQQARSKKWPPISDSLDASVRKRLAKVDLERMKWLSSSQLEFLNFEYFDPRIESRVKRN